MQWWRNAVWLASTGMEDALELVELKLRLQLPQALIEFRAEPVPTFEVAVDGIIHTLAVSARVLPGRDARVLVRTIERLGLVERMLRSPTALRFAVTDTALARPHAA